MIIREAIWRAVTRWAPERRAFGLIVVGLFSLTACSESELAVMEQPRIHFSEFDKDLGEIPVHSAGHEASFDISNRGTKDLVISRIMTDCGCTDAAISKSVISPGGSALLRVLVNPRSAEQRTASVTIHSDDPDRPQSRLTIQWRSVEPIEFEPLSLDFGFVRPETVVERNVRIVRRNIPGAGRPVRVDATPPDCLAATLDEGSDAVKLVLRPGRGSDVGAGIVRMFLEGGTKESIAMPIRWQVRDDFEVTPTRVFLGSGRPGQEYTRSMVVSVQDGRLEISDIRIGGFDGVASWKNTSPAISVVTFRATLPNRSGPVDGMVAVQCRSPDTRLVKIPVSGYVLDLAQSAGGAP